MQFDINRDLLLKSLNFVQGVVEKKNTLPILSNVLLNLKNNKLEIIATDLDIVFYDEISELKVVEEGNTKNIWGPRYYLELLSKRANDLPRVKIKTGLKDIAEIDASIKGLSDKSPWQSIRDLAMKF